MIRVLSLVALLWAAPAWADVPARLVAAFDGWLAGVGASNGVLTAHRDGQKQLSHGHGWRAERPVILAILSKSVTAVCAATLVKDGKLDPKMTSAEILGYGVPGITVAQLLTHASGLGPDQTQMFMQLWLDGAGSRAKDATQRALAREMQNGTAGQFAYNNENYAILGEIIAKVAGAPFGDTCTARVLTPAGAERAQISARVGTSLPWGGWEMPVTDFARFLEFGFGPDGIIGQDAAAWPAQPLNAHISYGMGMFQRVNTPTYNFWHFGAYCFPLRLNTGSYAVRWGNGWSVVAAYDACVSDAQMGALDRAMIEAVFQ